MEPADTGNNRCQHRRVALHKFGEYSAFTKWGGIVAVAKKLRIYLEDDLRADVQAKKHNFFKILTSSFESRGFKVELRGNTVAERMKSAGRNGYSLFHLHDPFHKNALDVRLAYMYPFWRIEHARWREDYLVSVSKFAPDDIPAAKAQRFFEFWQDRLHKQDVAKSAQTDFVFVPLQGRLLDKRHGQMMCPIDMVKETVIHERDRKIIVKLHPKEKYDATELDALSELTANARVQISEAPTGDLLKNCAYVVTENSGVAFKGLTYEKPAIAFGRTDFHHIIQSVEQVGSAAAFENVLKGKPDYAKYFYWFLQLNCINAGRADAGDRIIETCRNLGWEI